MKKLTYAEQRRDPRWQKKRLEIMERDRFSCCECLDDSKTLNVHHSYYVSGREPWDYPNWSLATLCEECHSEKHGGRNEEEDSAQQEWENALNILLEGRPDGANLLWILAVESNKSDVSLYGISELVKKHRET